MRVEEFLILWLEATEKGYLPMVDECAFIPSACQGPHSSTTPPAGWPVNAQVWLDMSFLCVSVEVLRQKRDNVKLSLRFSALLGTLVSMKPQISLRLRTFKGAKHADGCGDVGRHVWNLIEELEKNAERVEDVGLKGAEAWTFFKGKYPEFRCAPGDSDAMADKTFTDWYSDELLESVIVVARAVGKQSQFAEYGEAEDFLANLEEWLGKYANKRVAAWSLDGFFKEIKIGQELSLVNIKAFDLAEEAWRFADDIDDALHDYRHASSAKAEFRERLSLFNKLVELDDQIKDHEKKETSYIQSNSHLVRLWSDIWTKHQQIQATHHTMTVEDVQTTLELMRGSIDNFILSWFSRIFTMNVEEDIDASALSTAMELKAVLPPAVKKLIEASHGLQKIKEHIEEDKVGRKMELLDLCQPLPMWKPIASWAGTSAKTKVALNTYQDVLTKEINAWLKERCYGEFDDLLAKLQKAKHACETGDCKEAAWLLQNEYKEGDEPLREMQNKLKLLKKCCHGQKGGECSADVHAGS